MLTEQSRRGMLIAKEGYVRDACMFDIMAIPNEALKRVLPKVSIRMISRLISSYPRAIGRNLINVMAECLNPYTMDLLREEMDTNGRLPSLIQIREAEKEFLKTLYEEKILVETSSSK